MLLSISARQLGPIVAFLQSSVFVPYFFLFASWFFFDGYDHLSSRVFLQ